MNRADAERFASARERFEELVEVEEPERGARLARLAAESPELARAVEALLAADAAAVTFLGEPVAVEARSLVADWVEEGEGSRRGTTIGAYRLREPLGRGGMGEVWEAERIDGQFEQRAALKLLRPGMDSDEIVARFLRERQILARLVHPGIARLLDGGRSADGRPYFVLERVDGLPITEHCRARAATIEERVRLVAEACDAVESAHRQLVVHRDLKPSNILVDGEGRVKLLDFGIAKLLDDGGGDAALTRHGIGALTPAYAAPEQVLGEPVTTATDVYSLGVVLYELLVGSLPHRRTARTPAGLAAELSRETTLRPSSAARQVAELDERARRRLERKLRGDLDTILLRSLAREPERRYASAAALADDLRRHLAGRPVAARQDSAVDRAVKFVRRHRLGVAAAALVLLSLVGGLGAALWQARRAAASAHESAANARRAERTKEFLVSLFRVADPFQSGGATVSARDLLEQGARRLESELGDEPALKADLLDAVAEIQGGLGLVAEAEKSAAAALALRAPEETIARARVEARLGDLALQRGDLASAAERLERAVATLAREGAPPLVLARARSDYGAVLYWQKRIDEVLPLARQVYETYRSELGDEHVETAIQLRNLGSVLDELKQWDEAEAAFRSSQAVLERALGPDHVTLSASYFYLADLLYDRQRGDEGEVLLARAVAIRRRALGDHHLLTGQVLEVQAYYLSTAGRLDEAERAGREALAIFRALNPDHYEVGKSLNELGRIAARRGRQAEAERTFREALANLERSLGREHPFYWKTTGNLARAIAAQGRTAEAERLGREVLAELERLSGAESADAKWALERLAETLRLAGREAEAEASAARAKSIGERLASGG